MEQLNNDAMAQVLAITLVAISRQLDVQKLKGDMILLADAPGPEGLPGVREVVMALTKLLTTPTP
jgi:dihydroxyacid dehydratase/phosphogluconate dehydratase